MVGRTAEYTGRPWRLQRQRAEACQFLLTPTQIVSQLAPPCAVAPTTAYGVCRACSLGFQTLAPRLLPPRRVPLTRQGLLLCAEWRCMPTPLILNSVPLPPQGLFLAPQTTGEALKGGRLVAEVGGDGARGLLLSDMEGNMGMGCAGVDDGLAVYR